MFETLQDKLQTTFGGLRGKGKLDESDIDAAMREIRLALLEADVNFKVVRTFVTTVRERCMGAEVGAALDPGQQVVKIVDEELVRLMGSGASKLTYSSRGPTVVLMAGLQGSGKTTTCAKLARLLLAEGKKPALVACDVYRPAAIDQLVTVGAQVGVPVYQRDASTNPVKIAEWGLEQAIAEDRDVLIVDTAGRLHIDAELMDELVQIKRAVKPHNILLVLDAMTGQEAVSVALEFDKAVAFDGVVLTKLDGDARGGAALSVKSVTGKPVKFVSLGEKLDTLEYFHPDRMAGRILGMGDMLTLIEKAEQQFDEDEAQELERKMRKAQFTLDDFVKQMRRLKKIGSFGSILSMLPGVPKELRDVDIDDKQLARIEAIIMSMTPAERTDPKLLDGSRRKRVANGSGSDVQAVNQLIKQFGEMQKMMKQMMRGGKMPSMPGAGAGAGGGGMANNLLGGGRGMRTGSTGGGGKRNRKRKKRR